MRRARVIGGVLLLGLCLTLASSYVEGRAPMTYPDIDGCVPACSVVVAGSPFAFIADYPGISPVGSVSVFDALLGIDRVRVAQLAATLVCWTLVSAVGLWLVRSRPSRR